MKFLNLGCGQQYSSLPEWTNLDFVAGGEGVIAHNLLKGIPFNDDTFDLVYHSHVLEHFSKAAGERLIAECFRVLKPGGVLRIAVPDLEKIASNYLHFLAVGVSNPADEMNRLNYEWTLMEMYDQTVRNESGGNMAACLQQENIANEAFIFERIGEEGRLINASYHKKKLATQSAEHQSNKPSRESLLAKIKWQLNRYLLKKLQLDEKALQIGKFRLGGEIHQWMYDRYSLATLLSKRAVGGVSVLDAFSSAIGNWKDFNLDGKEGVVRKPDSLFMEAIK